MFRRSGSVGDTAPVFQRWSSLRDGQAWPKAQKIATKIATTPAHARCSARWHTFLTDPARADGVAESLTFFTFQVDCRNPSDLT